MKKKAGVVSMTILVLAILMYSCKKSGNHIATPAYAFNAKDYPLKVNNKWTYKVTDFYLHSVDTLVLKITGEQSINDTETDFFCTISEYNSIVDSGVYRLRGNKLTYNGLDSNYSYFGNAVFNFPITPNSYWIGFYPSDTVRLISIDSNINVNDTRYDNVFYVKRSFYILGGYSLVQSVQICQKVGIIEQTLYIFSGGPVQNQNFQLIDYALN